MDIYRYKALQMLNRARFFVIQNLTCEKERFANYLLLKCCGIAQDKYLPNSSATMLNIMENYDNVDDLANASLDDHRLCPGIRLLPHTLTPFPVLGFSADALLL